MSILISNLVPILSCVEPVGEGPIEGGVVVDVDIVVHHHDVFVTLLGSARSPEGCCDLLGVAPVELPDRHHDVRPIGHGMDAHIVDTRYAVVL